MRVCGDVVCVCIDSSQRVNVDVTCDAGKRGSLKDSVLACGHVCDGSKARIITVLPCAFPTAADSLFLFSFLVIDIFTLGAPIF